MLPNVLLKGFFNFFNNFNVLKQKSLVEIWWDDPALNPFVWQNRYGPIRRTGTIGTHFNESLFKANYREWDAMSMIRIIYLNGIGTVLYKMTYTFSVLSTISNNNWREFLANAPKESCWWTNSFVCNTVTAALQLQLKQNQITCGRYENITKRRHTKQLIELLPLENARFINGRTIVGNWRPITNITWN